MDSPSFAHVPDWSRGCIRGVLGVVKPETGFKPSLRHSRVPEDPHVIGRESDRLKFDWLDVLHVSRKF